MAHEFDSGMFTAKKAWHGLGTVVKTAPSTAEAIKLAKMDWLVTEQMLESVFPDGDSEVEEGWKSLKRSDNRKTLHICGQDWTPVQNHEAFAFFDPLIQDGDAQLDAAVSLCEGKRIAITAKITSGVAEVIKNDPVEQYVVLYNAHDGSLSLGVMFSNTRVVCANTLGFALREAKNKGYYKKFKKGDDIAIANRMIRLRHTPNIKCNLEIVRDAINLSHRQFDLTIEGYKAMAQTKMTDQLFKQYLENIFKADLTRDDGTVKPITDYSHWEQLEKNFHSGVGTDIKGVKGTVWAGFQSVTEFATHQRGRRNGGDDIEAARSRLNQMWFGNGAALIDKAQSEAIALV